MKRNVCKCLLLSIPLTTSFLFHYLDFCFNCYTSNNEITLLSVAMPWGATLKTISFWWAAKSTLFRVSYAPQRSHTRSCVLGADAIAIIASAAIAAAGTKKPQMHKIKMIRALMIKLVCSTNESDTRQVTGDYHRSHSERWTMKKET